jgi:hypothetical protein
MRTAVLVPRGEVCLEFDLPPAQGVRCVVATFENERGDLAELTDVPAGTSECVVQKPTQIGLQGRADYPGFYEMKPYGWSTCRA